MNLKQLPRIDQDDPGPQRRLSGFTLSLGTISSGSSITKASRPCQDSARHSPLFVARESAHNHERK
jgi:hypothetical protein